MRTSPTVIRAAAAAAMALGALVPALRAADPPNFKPDGTFTGSTLAGWHVVGNADWKAQSGELIGTARPGGGWLVMDKSFQDVDFFTNYKCVGSCAAGILLRAQKTPDGGMRGIYLSLSDGDLGTYAVTVDAQGKETGRERIAAAGRGGGGGGQGGGAARAGGAAGAAPAGGGGGQGGAAARGGGQGQGGGAAPAAAGGGGGGGGRGGQPALKANDWNPIEVILSNTTLRAVPGGGGPIGEADAAGFGPVALFVGSGEVHFKDVAWKDLIAIADPRPVTSARYNAIEINSFYYGWSAAASDINHDGNLDVVAGPFWFPGPSFTERRIYRDDRMYNPAVEYAPDMVNRTADFTGDGWPDILASGMTGGRPMDLYVNPKGESRRWTKHRVLPTINTEIVLLKDLDKDGKPEVLFGGGGTYNWAHPDPANPTAVWTSHPISVAGQQTVTVHGLGVGDVNSDGRLDVVMPLGWFEQPAGGIEATPWTFHKAFWPANEFSNGGGEMGVYDVNGDGLTDVIGGSAHAWGLVWFEQKKDGSFVQHQITGDLSAKNAGGVAFSESHAERFADMNGDKIPDMIVGKRYWSHLENYGGPDPYGPAVLYIYRTVRNPKAEGGAEFVPELVHNKSGVGSSFEVADLNKDGVPDIATSGAYGVYVFLSKSK